jgi:hypothetical protein
VYEACTGLDVYRGVRGVYRFFETLATTLTTTVKHTTFLIWVLGVTPGRVHQGVVWCTRRVLDWTCTAVYEACTAFRWKFELEVRIEIRYLESFRRVFRAGGRSY